MNIADLPNFGPKSRQMLAQAGIVTVEQLRELGAVPAYVQVRHVGKVSLNLLWAMEGALSGRHWQDVAQNDRLRLLLELEDVERATTKPKREVKGNARAFNSVVVAKTFESYPSHMRNKLLALRELIYQIAAETEGVGTIEETLKWGEPAYLTSNKSGSTIRLAWKKSTPTQYALYFHCQTNLIETFRTLFPSEFKFEGNRAIVFDEADIVPTDSVSFCIAAALTYHRRKTASRKGCK